MAADKQMRRLERKIDALLEHAKIDLAQFETGESAPRPPRELTPQEQEAIDNAPKAEATIPPQEHGPRVTEQNAPSTASSVPKASDKGDAKKSKK